MRERWKIHALCIDKSSCPAQLVTIEDIFCWNICVFEGSSVNFELCNIHIECIDRRFILPRRHTFMFSNKAKDRLFKLQNKLIKPAFSFTQDV